MRHAFTLIELLIVVAIIAILAAIAVPNFLEAQTRAKISRTKNDMRALTTALESYMVDGNAYPTCNRTGTAMTDTPPYTVLERLSTPIAYMTSASLKDPFKVSKRFSSATAQAMMTETPATVNATDMVGITNSYIYQSFNAEQRCNVPTDNYNSASKSLSPRAYILHSCGPDSTYYNLGGVLANDRAAALPYTIQMLYDATNGTVSRGSIWRTGGMDGASSTYAAGEGLIMAIRSQN